MKNTLICNELTIYKNDHILIKNLSLSIKPGAHIYLNGENGSGKTSLLRCLARLNIYHHGSIFYNDCNVDDYINEYKQIIIYISDKEQLIDSFTVFQTLEIWSMLYASEMLIPAAISTLNLEDVVFQPIHNLSKGLKKRVILSRLLLQNARIWLLDEPFTFLDEQHITIVENIIKMHTYNGGIAIIADHFLKTEDLTKKTIAEVENIEYKNCYSSQKTLLKIQDFKVE